MRHETYVGAWLRSRTRMRLKAYACGHEGVRFASGGLEVERKEFKRFKNMHVPDAEVQGLRRVSPWSHRYFEEPFEFLELLERADACCL